MCKPTEIALRAQKSVVELPTFLLLVVTYGIWTLSTSYVFAISPIFGIILAGLAIAQYSSLQHEVLHGHPFRNQRLNEALATPALTLTVPYGRFRDTHLAHHHDPILTDPYDDPETNFVDPAVWNRMPSWAKTLLSLNNTLLGRMVIGPILGNALWLVGEARLLAAGDRDVRRDWSLHMLGLVPVVAWLGSQRCHGGAIRTFLEHRAHEVARARTVVVEDRGPLALLFLNNNLHVVHHMHPNVAWYRLPALYRANRAHYLRRNEGYAFKGYGEVFRNYLLRAKDPVPHPLWTGGLEAGGLEQAAEGRPVAPVVEKRHSGFVAAAE
jgi:fatty acid desaturase